MPSWYLFAPHNGRLLEAGLPAVAESELKRAPYFPANLFLPSRTL